MKDLGDDLHIRVSAVRQRVEPVSKCIAATKVDEVVLNRDASELLAHCLKQQKFLESWLALTVGLVVLDDGHFHCLDQVRRSLLALV